MEEKLTPKYGNSSILSQWKRAKTPPQKCKGGVTIAGTKYTTRNAQVFEVTWKINNPGHELVGLFLEQLSNENIDLSDAESFLEFSSKCFNRNAVQRIVDNLKNCVSIFETITSKKNL